MAIRTKDDAKAFVLLAPEYTLPQEGGYRTFTFEEDGPSGPRTVYVRIYAANGEWRYGVSEAGEEVANYVAIADPVTFVFQRRKHINRAAHLVG